MSGWRSSINNLMSGRFSPFGGPTRDNSVSGGHNEVTDQDFSYITADDLAAHHEGPIKPASYHHSHSHGSHQDKDRPKRDTDLLIFRHRNVQYPIHFSAYSISDGLLTVGAAREQIARKLEVHDPGRIRMFWKGRNLKDDSATCLHQGLRSTDNAEILCVIGDPDRDASDSGSDGSVDGRQNGEAAEGKTRKKKRSRTKKKKSRKGGLDSGSGSGTSSPIPVAEHLPMPSNAHPLHRPSAATPRDPSPAPAPQTPMAKLGAIEDKYRDELKPAAEAYMAVPPTDQAKKEFEHKKHAEMILAQVLLKLDGVETEGDEDARTKRRALVRDVQGFLSKLDAFVK